MKFSKIISAALLALALTGCGQNGVLSGEQVGSTVGGTSSQIVSANAGAGTGGIIANSFASLLGTMGSNIGRNYDHPADQN